MASVSDLRSFDEDSLQRLRERAAHVIVVMFENRSFDHLLGLLDHPKLEPTAPEHEHFRQYFVKPGSHTNPNTSAGRRPCAAVTDDATPVLERDPPHGHMSALRQIDREGAGNPQMDGFVDTYAAKLSGNEPVPTKRWGRIVAAALIVVLLVGSAFAGVANYLSSGGRWWPPAIVAAVIAFGVWWMVRHLPIASSALKAALPAVVGIVAAFGVDGLAGWHLPFWYWGWFGIGVAIGIIGGVIGYKRYLSHMKPPRMDKEAAADTASRIMACVHPATIKHLSFLAKNYVTCVNWYSSVPGATWPNRNFAHAATSDESTDIEAGLYYDRTIFELLESEQPQLPAGVTGRTPWRVYFHDTPQVVAFPKLWRRRERWKNWAGPSGLLRAIDKDCLPTYAFVEPCHSASNGSKTNSQHPGNNEIETGDFERAEELIRDIYVRLAENPEVFKRTVLIITYDEHGGFFDHMRPPETRPPESGFARYRARSIFRRLILSFLDYGTDPFAFDRLGIRVPTVIVSPWITPNHLDETRYDHASIVASLRRLWAPNQKPLSDRDKVAKDIWDLIDDSQLGSSDPTIVDVPDDWDQLATDSREPLISRTPPLTAAAARKSGLPSFEVGLAFLDEVLSRKLPQPGELRGERTSGATRLRRIGDSTDNGNPNLDDFDERSTSAAI